MLAIEYAVPTASFAPLVQRGAIPGAPNATLLLLLIMKNRPAYLSYPDFAPPLHLSECNPGSGSPRPGAPFFASQGAPFFARPSREGWDHVTILNPASKSTRSARAPRAMDAQRPPEPGMGYRALLIFNRQINQSTNRRLRKRPRSHLLPHASGALREFIERFR